MCFDADAPPLRFRQRVVVDTTPLPLQIIHSDTNQRVRMPDLVHDATKLQAVHTALPDLVEVAEVSDAAHNSIAAHWHATRGRMHEPLSGTYVLHFDDSGLIDEVVAYHDVAADEYLDA